jgi:hypothetical protein
MEKIFEIFIKFIYSLKLGLLGFSLSFSPLVFAEGVGTTQAAAGSAQSASNALNSGDIAAQSRQLHEAEGLDDIGVEQIWGIINSLVIGYVSATLVKRCFTNMSFEVALASAGGITYIAAEIMATLEDKDIREEIEVNFNNAQQSGDKDTQLEALKAQRDGYIKIQQTAENKSILQKTAAAAIAAAGGIALYRYYMIESTGGAASCVVCAAPAVGTIKSLLLTPLTFSIPEDIEVKGLSTTIIATCTAEATVAAGIVTNCNKWLGEVNATLTTCSLFIPAAVSNPFSAPSEMFSFANFIDQRIDHDYYLSKNSNSSQRNSLKKLIKSLLIGGEFLLPKAEAFGMSSLLGLGAVAAGVFLGLQEATKFMMDLWIGSPFTRGLMFEAVAASILLASTYSADVAESMGRNVEDIDKLIDGYGNRGQDQQRIGTATSRTAGRISAVNSQSIDGNNRNGFSGIGQPTPCFTVQNSSGACGSIEAGLPDSAAREFLGTAGSQFAGDVVNFANSVNGKKGVSGATLQGGAALASKGAFAQKRLAKVKSSLGDILKKSGQSPKLLVQGPKKFGRDLRRALSKKLKKSNATPQSLVAGLGASTTGSTRGLRPDSRIAASSGKSSGGKGLANLGSGSAPKANRAKAEAINFSFDDEEGAGLDQEDISLSDSKGPEDVLGSTKGGVNEDRTKSIFKILTRRYIESAYPILFDEDIESAFD